MRVLCVVVIAGTLAGAGCSQPSNPMSPTRTDAAVVAGARPSDGATGTTAALSAQTSQLLATVRRATAAFHDVSNAVAAGYGAPSAVPCVQSPAGAMGHHAGNQGLINDGVIDALTPEVLLYLPSGSGEFRLVGVEYLQPILLRNPETDEVAPWFGPAPWPPTYEVLTPAPSLFGATFAGPMAGHEPSMPWHYDLHTWAWSPNPNGLLAQFNPALSCTGN